MANKVSYLIQLQNRFSRNAKKINADMKGIDRSADKAARTINNKLSGSFKNLKNTAKNAFGAVIAAFSVREFITRGAAFQDSIADLSAITGAAGKDLANLSDETLRLAKISVTSQSEVARAIKLVASAKPELLDNLSALTATTEQVLLLKNAGVELEVAAIAVAEGLNIFGESSKFAARNVNILAAGSKLGSSEIRDTAEALKIAGPGARAAGLSFLQLNAAIQTVAKGGIKASQAGTALNSIFGRLRRLGFDFQKLGLEGTFKKVAEILGRVSDSTQRAKLEAKIFGEEHAKVGLALVNNVEFLGRFEKSLKGTNVAQEQADIRLGTFSAKLRGLGILLNEKIIKTFIRLEPVITKQVEQLGEFFDTIDPERVDAFAKSLTQVARGMGAIGKGLGFIATGFSKVGTFIGESAAKIALAAEGRSDLIGASGRLNFGAGLPSGISPSESGTLRFLEGLSTPGGAAPSFQMRSQTDVNINLRAPERTVESIKTRTSGKMPGLNVGVNMEAAG